MTKGPPGAGGPLPDPLQGLRNYGTVAAAHRAAGARGATPARVDSREAFLLHLDMPAGGPGVLPARRFGPCHVGQQHGIGSHRALHRGICCSLRRVHYFIRLSLRALALSSAARAERGTAFAHQLAPRASLEQERCFSPAFSRTLPASCAIPDARSHREGARPVLFCHKAGSAPAPRYSAPAICAGRPLSFCD